MVPKGFDWWLVSWLKKKYKSVNNFYLLSLTTVGMCSFRSLTVPPTGSINIIPYLFAFQLFNSNIETGNFIRQSA